MQQLRLHILQALLRSLRFGQITHETREVATAPRPHFADMQLHGEN
jgi:hypothetical protein